MGNLGEQKSEYHFGDWLEDKIDFKIAGINIMKSSNGLTHLYGKKLLSKTEYEKIKNHQIKAFDIAVELSLEYCIWDYTSKLTKSINRERFINHEIKITENRLNKDSSILRSVLTGQKDYLTLKGSDYKSIMKKQEEFRKAKLNKDLFQACFAINDNMHITWLNKYFEFLKKNNPYIKNKPIKTIPQTLLEIWVPDKDGSKYQYELIVKDLKQNFAPPISGPLLREVNNKRYWRKDYKGAILYLTGFIYTCIKNGWINPIYSAPQYGKILNNTFNIIFNVGPFKNLMENPPKEKYLKPFKKFPQNN